MFAGAEIAIVAVFLFLLFGYKYLPAIGRSAGKGAKELKDSVGGMVGQHDVNSESIGRSAGKGMREVRELRDAFKEPVSSPKPKPTVTGEAELKSEPDSAE